MTLGSLFSGSGSFELAGVLSGITPAFASEIEPYPIAVTTSRFPHMKHLGSVTEVHGDKIEPVDVITMGSPCFPAGTLVMTLRGYIPIEDVQIGDQVLTHLGRWKPVTKVGHKEWNTIILKGCHYGQEVTPEHPIWSAETQRYYPCLGNGKRGNYRRLKNVGNWTAAKDMLHMRWAIPTVMPALDIPYAGGDAMPPLNEDFMYFLGMWLGDGWLSNRGGQIFLCAAGEKISRARDVIARVFPNNAHCHERQERTTTRFCISCCELANWMRENFDCGAANKTLPAWAYGMSESMSRALFDGYMVADGSQQDEHTWRTTTVSKKLAHGIRLLAQTLGYSTAVFRIPVAPQTEIEGRTVNQRTQYQVHFYDSRRRSSLQTHAHAWNIVKTILPGASSKTVYNITVEEDHSYLVEGVVVHNCQDVSIAGKQAGINEGRRSSLFFEGIRIIKEMRKATHGKYPQFVVFENVPGLFSSGKGEDFRTVLESCVSLCDDTVSVPQPPKGKWLHAGEILGDHYSLAWRVQGAEHWGVPQRRNRIYLVLDLGGQRAGKVLFEQESLRGNPPQSAEARQDTAAHAEGSAGGSGERLTSEGYAIRPCVCNESGRGYWMQGFGCLRAEGENRPSRPSHVVCAQSLTYALQGNGIDRADTAGCNGCGWHENLSYTLNTIDRHAVCYQQTAGAQCAADWRGPNSQYVGQDKLIATPICTDTRGNGDGKVCSTVTGDHENRVTDYTNIITYGGDTAGTLDASYYKGAGARNGKEREFVAERKPDRKYMVRRLSTTECARLQGLPDCWAIPVHKDSMTDEEAAFWEQVRKTHAEINGKRYAPYAKREQLVAWYNRLRTDSAEYKLYGNGIALPCAAFVLRGIALALKEEES